jgi:TPR repeat protein
VYSSGKIVPKDEKESARWERLAAAQGIPTAIGGLAMQYFGGRLVPKSMLIAYALRRLARILNPTDERDTILQVTGERLTAEERETADLLLIELAKPDNLLPALERASSEIVD